MSKPQAESVIKNIIREIAQECAGRGQEVSETLVAFMVKAVVLDPNNHFNVDRTLTKEDVQRLISSCVARLMDETSPSLATVKMQVYFDMNYTTRADFLEEHRRVLETRLSPVVREITDSRARNRDELEALYRKIVSCVLLRSGLGSPTDITVVREATAALQSVFPHTELGTFMSMIKQDKEKQLQELSQIVSGIRLFNQECGKGGDGIDDLPAVLGEAIPATISKIQTEIDGTREMAYKFTAIVEELSSKPETSSTDVSLPLLKQCLTNVRQLETFLTVVLHEVIECGQQTETLDFQFKARLENLRNTVQSKTAVPTAQVYPQFINVSHIWSGFQDEMVLLSVLTNIQSSLAPFSKVVTELFPPEVLEKLLQGIKIKTDNDRLTETDDENCRIKSEDIPRQDVELFYPDGIKNFYRLPILYRGYCAWSLVNDKGFILPSNPAIGVVMYDSKYYAFSTKEACYEFMKDPEKHIADVASAAKKSPELIQLLELHSQFSAISPYEVNGAGSGKLLIHSHAGMFDLFQANLRTKVTQSMQTNLSNYKRDNTTQVYLPKDGGTQTKREESTSVPKPSRYIAGLRGCKTTKTTISLVELTLDVDQT
ncbi:cilia- and flagella-associated protein 206-like [Xenia sp. Carnegie-2017]|uniref:cilia- and flagella-associated protein 206-like n=1 Tax=Xenia sp. Carnegie-2017 TaxID=2897299 RepID=UPI001F03CF6A|nr:cilia- and flagella-associated protein 206-like [Xenia sp. Carnegie-2017]